MTVPPLGRSVDESRGQRWFLMPLVVLALGGKRSHAPAALGTPWQSDTR